MHAKEDFHHKKILVKADLPGRDNVKLAELIGILLGDGYLSTMQVYICLHSILEYPYAQKLKRLIADLFHKIPEERHFKNKRAMQLRFSSKIIVDFLTQDIGLPSGRRIRNPKNKIPKYFFEDKTLLQACIRGLFDTEGGFYQRHHRAARIYIYNDSPQLLQSIYEALHLLGYHIQLKKDCIKLGRTSEIVRFFDEIQPRNNYKIIKYQTWKATGYVPKNTEIILRQ